MLDGGPLAIEAVHAVARLGARVQLGDGARANMGRMRSAMLARCAGGDPHYGINTGFGSFAQVRLPDDQLDALQTNLIRSHSAGVGEPLDSASVRAMMIVLAASLARGHSGVRPGVVDSIVAHLNSDIVPIVPSRGSVGASGDLAPLAHIAQALIGEGLVRYKGQQIAASVAHAQASTPKLVLEAKEGLALINGTHLMASMGALALVDAQNLLSAALCSTAMAIDGCRASVNVLDERIHAVRKQPGQQMVARLLSTLLKGTQIAPAHAVGDPRVQDPYALRASPQVLGAVVDAIEYCHNAVTRELGAVTDNPLIFPSTRAGATPGSVDIVSGANFHGMPMAIALDLLKIALCHLAGIAERRIYWALSGQDRHSHLSAHLAVQGGLESGLMIVQYSAAACCNELRTLAYPSSVGNISTCAGIEDYNSMGATSALHARDAVRLARDVVACELLVMAQAIDCQRPLLSGSGVEVAHKAIRSVVAPLVSDRSPSPDIAAIALLIANGSLSGFARG